VGCGEGLLPWLMGDQDAVDIWAGYVAPLLLLDVVAQNLEIFALLELVEEVEDGVLHLVWVTIILHGDIGEISYGSYSARLGVGHRSCDDGERAQDDKNSENLPHASASSRALWTFCLIALYNIK